LQFQRINKGLRVSDFVSMTKSSSSLNLVKIPMVDLKPIIEDELTKHGLAVSLENIGEDLLELQIKRSKYESQLRLTRNRHKPLEINVEADFNHYNWMKAQGRRNKSNNNQSRGGLSRYYFYFWIFMGLIIWSLTFLSELFVFVLFSITPGWSNNQRYYLLVGFLIFYIILRVYIIPKQRKKQIIFMHQMDIQLLKIVHLRLDQVNKEFKSTEILRCWSCFEIINFLDKVCPHCEAHQKT